MGYIHRFAFDSAYKPIYDLAKKFKVPVVFHTGDTYSTKGKLKYADPLTIDELRAHLLERKLMTRKLPEQLEIVDALPRNSGGKVLKHELRQRYAETAAG